MSYQPVLPLSGYSGWRFLQKTLDKQQASFNQSRPVQTATDYFRANVSKAKTAADLVKDRRLLQVALGAFGLSGDVNSKAFIQKVLEGGTTDTKSLANKMTDKRYASLAAAFGYGDSGAKTGRKGFADTIIARFQKQAFQEAVGETDNTMRLALNLSDGIAEIVDRTANTNAQWYSLMGNTPLRNVFETALGLPSSTATLDVDRQLVIFKSRAQAAFGTDKLSNFDDSDMQEKLIRLFLGRSDLQKAAASPASMALQLLGSG